MAYPRDESTRRLLLGLLVKHRLGYCRWFFIRLFFFFKSIRSCKILITSIFSITTERAEQICQRLHDKGFATTNVVLGIGSFTYQFNTRDTFGFAMKATSVVVNGKRREIFKDPVTDDGVKKSAKGLIKVELENGEYKLVDEVSETEENEGELSIIYQNGGFFNQINLEQVRERINGCI